MSDDGAILLPHGVRLLPSPDKQVFGYGDHPSTKRCLAWLEAHVTPGCTVADVGGGTGVLAIKAALLGARYVVCYEADAHARALALRNVEANNVTDKVLVCGAFPEDWDGMGFDLLVANLGQDGLAYDWDEYADLWFDEHRAPHEQPATKTVEVPADAVVEQNPDGSLTIRPRRA